VGGVKAGARPGGETYVTVGLPHIVCVREFQHVIPYAAILVCGVHCAVFFI